jgi:hypothetical protein
MGTGKDLPVLTAFFAETIQANLMPGRSIARRFPKFLGQGMLDWQIKISHSPTTLADKVMVRQGCCLEPVKPASKVESAHQPLFHKNPQVPVDGTQTEVWKFLSHPVEYPFRRRVALGLSKDFKDTITLSTLASLSRHCCFPVLRIGIVIVYTRQHGVMSIGCPSVAKRLQRSLLFLCAPD